MERDDDEGLFRTIASRVLRSYRTDPRFERMVPLRPSSGHEVALAICASNPSRCFSR